MENNYSSVYLDSGKICDISMLNLQLQYQSIKKGLMAAIEAVLESGIYINGPQVSEFEKNMAQFLGVNHAIGVASGSDALILALHVLGIGPGDKVVVPSFTFIATAEAVSRMGATPVFADIDPFTYNLSPAHLRAIIQKVDGIKAVIPVHLFGLPCAMNQIMQVAAENHLYVVEDACQAINATFEFKGTAAKAGTVGTIGCFSFFPTKNLGGFGDGGMLVTNDDELARKIRLLKEHGSNPKYFHQTIGYNSRLDTIQAAILTVKLKHLKEWTIKRREAAACYNREFTEAGIADQFILPGLDEGHVFNQYVIQSEHRSEIALQLREHGIATAVYYPRPLHLQEAYRELGYQPGSLPVSETICERVLALPIDPFLSAEQIRHIVAQIAGMKQANI